MRLHALPTLNVSGGLNPRKSGGGKRWRNPVSISGGGLRRWLSVLDAPTTRAPSGALVVCVENSLALRTASPSQSRPTVLASHAAPAAVPGVASEFGKNCTLSLFAASERPGLAVGYRFIPPQDAVFSQVHFFQSSTAVRQTIVCEKTELFMSTRQTDGLGSTCFSGTCRGLMRPAASRVHHHLLQVRLLHSPEKVFEMTFAAPVGVALVHRAPFAQSLGQIAPGCTRAGHPQQGTRVRHQPC